MKTAVRVAAKLLLMPSLLMALVPATVSPVNAALNAQCDLYQTDNSWVARSSETVSTWIETASARITYYNYALCEDPGIPFLRPEQSSSSAWVAIEGPHLGGLLGGNSIIQVGYIKCQNSSGCAVSGIDSSHWNRVVYFYAFGNANDLFHMPFPQYIADADSSTPHDFEVRLHYLGGGARQWEFKVDGVIRKVLDDNWRTWNRDHAQVANEIWNEGDQLGGRTASGSDPGNKQKFHDVVWKNGTTHYGLSGSIIQTGHCYPWASWDTIDSQNWNTWTTSYHTNC